MQPPSNATMYLFGCAGQHQGGADGVVKGLGVVLVVVQALFHQPQVLGGHRNQRGEMYAMWSRQGCMGISLVAAGRHRAAVRVLGREPAGQLHPVPGPRRGRPA